VDLSPAAYRFIGQPEMGIHTFNLALMLIVLMAVLSFPLRWTLSLALRSIVQGYCALMREPLERRRKANSSSRVQTSRFSADL
jgi:hypothetical protein